MHEAVSHCTSPNRSLPPIDETVLECGERFFMSEALYQEGGALLLETNADLLTYLTDRIEGVVGNDGPTTIRHAMVLTYMILHHQRDRDNQLETGSSYILG